MQSFYTHLAGELSCIYYLTSCDTIISIHNKILPVLLHGH